MTSTLTERHNDVLSPVHRMFPRMTDKAIPDKASTGVLPWGLRFAEEISAQDDQALPEVTYDPVLQIGVVADGTPACAIEPLTRKKSNTVEDGQTWPDEHPQ